MQFDLFSAVLDVYQSEQSISNKGLYKKLQSLGFDVENSEKKEISGNVHNTGKIKVRWIQQTMKVFGLIKKCDTQRGVWEVLKKTDSGLNEINDGEMYLAFKTDLGMSVLSSCKTFFNRFNWKMHLICLSAPYPLRNPRDYGNVKESEYVDWFVDLMAPAIARLEDGGSLALNLGSDIFLDKSPARSLYVQKLMIRLNEKYGLSFMDNLIWQNPTKPPGPIHWASKNRVHLNATYENIIWMTNNPDNVFSDNRRVLLPHTESHLKLINAGGEKKPRINSDGAYRIYEGSFSNQTEGRIPRNILSFAHRCKSQSDYKKNCIENGIKHHGAPMPLSLAKFLIQFLTEEKMLVADTMSGSGTIPYAAEILKRFWISTDKVFDYVKGSTFRFEDRPGFHSYI